MEKAVKPVFDPMAIERELLRLERENSSGYARTTLFNLVIFERPGEEDRVEDLLAFLLGKRAARVIRILREGAEKTRISVAARCIPDREDRGVCFQEILIQCGADGVGQAPGTWASLLVRDIPVYVLWLEDFDQHEETLDYAAEMADKIILDTDKALEAGNAFEGLFATIRDRFVENRVAVSDFAWHRITPLRNLTATVFEETQRIDDLDKITEVLVSGCGASAARLYWLWLSLQLGWEALDDRMDKKMPSIRYKQAPETADAAVAELVFGFEGAPELRLVLREGLAEFEDGRGGWVQRAVKTLFDGEILLKEIDAPSVDPLYLKTLGALAER